ncbi:MAG: GNAT family N-acetyltransferase [Acidobacteria bacterium]|nr:GNAT family N-acetyltransferase [Acidobacteriota bacterium]
MALEFRPAQPPDFAAIQKFVIESFEPITWFKRVDERFGPMNGKDWRRRWELRLAAAFRSQTLLVGETEGRVVAFASGSVDPDTRVGFIDLLAVDRRFQRRGCGRAMLNAMMRHMKQQGAVYASLDCMADNDPGNSLYRAEGFQEVARQIRWQKKIP